MRIHRGEVLKCSVNPNCQYSTPKKSLMIAHERTHKQERPFKCDICEKAFVENSALTRHKRIHSDELPFPCQICSFKTRRRDKLKHHLLKKHNYVEDKQGHGEKKFRETAFVDCNSNGRQQQSEIQKCM